MEKVHYYSIMTKSSVQESYSGVDNKYMFPISISSKIIQNLSDRDDEEEEKFNMSDTDMSDSDIPVSMSSLICNYQG